MKPRAVRLPDGRVWLRVADPDWADPLDTSFARMAGGRWNPPDSFPTLYLNGDVVTARLQLERLLAGSPVRPEDLDDGAFVLVAATLPRAQRVADAVSSVGLEALGLPTTYPLGGDGQEVPRAACQAVGERVREARLRGVWCRSAADRLGEARELAWFPATRRSLARPVWPEPLPLGGWRGAVSWSDIGLGEQRDPE